MPQTTNDQPPNARKTHARRARRCIQNAYCSMKRIDGIFDEVHAPSGALFRPRRARAARAEQPLDVRPAHALVRVVRIERLRPCARDARGASRPSRSDRPGARACRTSASEVLDGLRHGEAAVRQQAVEPERDADHAGRIVEHDRQDDDRRHEKRAGTNAARAIDVDEQRGRSRPVYSRLATRGFVMTSPFGRNRGASL